MESIGLTWNRSKNIFALLEHSTTFSSGIAKATTLPTFQKPYYKGKVGQNPHRKVHTRGSIPHLVL